MKISCALVETPHTATTFVWYFSVSAHHQRWPPCNATFRTAAYDSVAIHGGSMCSRECISGACPAYPGGGKATPSCSFGNDTMDGRATNCGLVCGGGCEGCKCPGETGSGANQVAAAKCFPITYAAGVATCLYPYEVDPCYEWLRGSCFGVQAEHERCLGCAARYPEGAKAAGCTLPKIHSWCQDR